MHDKFEDQAPRPLVRRAERRLSRYARAGILGVVLVSVSVASGQQTEESRDARRAASMSRTQAPATDAYIYGYPLVLTEFTRRVMLASGQVEAMNRFKHTLRLLGPDDTSVRRSNNDTLYSVAFLDLKAEPIILHVPDTAGLYYVMQVMDAWTNTFAAPGTRTTGTAAQDFAIVGPDWKGRLPRPITTIKSPTNLVWMIGRTQVKTEIPPEGTCLAIDYSAVHSVQQQYTLTPMSQWGQSAKSPVVSVAGPQAASALTPPDLVAQLTGVQFFQFLSALMRDNPAAEQDMPAVKALEAIGFVPGAAFQPPAGLAEEINAAPGNAVALMRDQFTQHLGQSINGWSVTTSGIGAYGTDYLTRAALAWGAPGANLPKDGIYPSTAVAMTMVDGETVAEHLHSSKKYVIHFDPVPPVSAFWSIAVYDANGYMVQNSICRYAIHSTDQAILDRTAIDILLQPDPPSEPSQIGFWLPTPATAGGAPFSVMLRMYWPDQSAQQGKWVPPPILIQ